MATTVIESLSRGTLRRHIAALCPEIYVIGEAKNAGEILSLIRSRQPELIFPDTDWPPVNGYSLSGVLESRASFELILTMDHEQAPATVRGSPFGSRPFGCMPWQAVRAAIRKKAAANNQHKKCLKLNTPYAQINIQNRTHPDYTPAEIMVGDYGHCFGYSSCRSNSGLGWSPGTRKFVCIDNASLYDYSNGHSLSIKQAESGF
ncbi:MAG: hypothetical protein ABIR15_16160 [Chitinophagaceae bacterium]